MSGLQHDRHFSVAQAQAMLREVLPAVERIAELKRLLDARGFDVYRHEYFKGMGPNGQKFFPTELEELVEVARLLDSKGVILKNLDTGLIDFPHVRENGEEVYLCFQLGEDGIEFWHSIADGFAGRKPLELL